MSPGKVTLQLPLDNPTLHITTHNADGKGTMYESREGDIIEYAQHMCQVVNVYGNDQQPPELSEDVDLARSKAIVGAENTPIVQSGGVVVRIVDIGPGNLPMMHQTQSLDYLVLLQGSLIMAMADGSETLVKAGDVVVQRATMHSWRNPSKTEWARIFAVLQDIRPLTVHGKVIQENLGNGAGHFGAKEASS